VKLNVNKTGKRHTPSPTGGNGLQPKEKYQNLPYHP